MNSSAKILGFVSAALAWLVLLGAPAPSFDFSRTTLEISSRQQAVQQPKRFDVGRSELPSSVRERSGVQRFLKRGGAGDGKLDQEPAAAELLWDSAGQAPPSAAVLGTDPHLSRSSNRPRAPPLDRA